MTPARVKEELDCLEYAHKMSTREFYTRFHDGTLDENTDYVRWVWLCTVAMRQGMLSFEPVRA